MHEEGAQLGLVQRPRAQPPEAQTLPQAPQLLGSVIRSTHWSLGHVVEGAVHTGAHEVSTARAVVVVVVVGVTVSVA